MAKKKVTAKKVPSKLRTLPEQFEAGVSIQSAAERKSAEAELNTLVKKFAVTHLRLIGAVRRWLRNRLPTAHEIVYEYRDWFVISYSPSEHGYEGVLSIHASSDGVKLYFNNAKALDDPAKLLQGTGKQARWIKLERASSLAREEVAGLIEEALKHNTVPFETHGAGFVTVRTTTAKRRSASE